MTDQAPVDNGQGTPVVPNTTASLTTPPAQPQNTPAPSWLSGADDLTVGYVQNKGWSDPKQVLDGYRNLEKLLGADKANNAIVIPKPDADGKEWDAVYNRLGRPDKPDGYKIELPEGTDKTFADESAAKFHELGLTRKQGEQLAAWYNEKSGASLAQIQQQREQMLQADEAALKAEWGAAYQQNLTAAQNAVRGLGLIDKVDDLVNALGQKTATELFYKIGSKLSEDTFTSGSTPQGFSNIPTPAQAQAQIQALRSDKNFVTRYTSGDANARQEMQKLHEYAFPEVKQ